MAFLAREFASDSSWTSPFTSFRRSAFSSGQSSRLLTGARAESYDQIVDLPTLQIQERVSERVVEQIVDLAVPQTCALPRVWLVLAQLDVLRNWKETEAYKNELPIADRARLIVAKMRLPALGTVLTVFGERDRGKKKSSCVELECGTTPLVRDDSARSHLMSAQLGWNQPSGGIFELFHPAKIRKIPRALSDSNRQLHPRCERLPSKRRRGRLRPRAGNSKRQLPNCHKEKVLSKQRGWHQFTKGRTRSSTRAFQGSILGSSFCVCGPLMASGSGPT